MVGPTSNNPNVPVATDNANAVTGVLINATTVSGQPLGVRPSFPSRVTKVNVASGTNAVVISAPGQTLHTVVLCSGATSTLTLYDDNVVATVGHEMLLFTNSPVGPITVTFDIVLQRGVWMVVGGPNPFETITVVLGLI